MPEDATIGHSRSRDVLRGGLVGASSRVIAMTVGFALLPLTIDRAGTTTYGLFAALTSFSSLLTFADFGIGNGLIRRLAVARTVSDGSDIDAATTTALVILLITGATICTVTLLGAPHLPWTTWLNASTSARHSLDNAAIILGLCVGVAVPGALAQKVYLSFQRASQANLWTASASVTSSIAICAAASNDRLPLMVAAQLGLPALFGLSALGWLSARHRVAIRWQFVSKRVAADLLRTGRLFAILQTAAVVNYEVDAIVVSHFKGPIAVTTFAATSRPFAAPLVIAGLFYTPLWAAFADASAHGDRAWIRRAYWQATSKGLIVLTPLAIGLVVTAEPLIRAWTRGTVHAPESLVVALGVWMVVFAYNQPQAMLLNGLHVERFQLKITAATVTMNVVLSVILTVEWGISGPIWGTVIAQIICATFPATIYLRKHQLSDRGQSINPPTAAEVR